MQEAQQDRVAPIPSLRFSTEALDPKDQFEAYRADALGFAELVQPQPGAACPASYTCWSLGSVVVKVTDAPPLDQRRTPEMARRDGLDHWLITLPRHSELTMDLGGRRKAITAARPALISCHEPYRIQRRAAEKGWLIFFVARDALPGVELPDGMEGDEALASPMGRLFVGYLRQMAEGLPGFSADQAPALREATIQLMRATLAPGLDHRMAARPPMEGVLRERARRMIRERLASATLTPERLCRELGISRSTLYRLFEPSGGVAAAIQAERLAEARRLLEDGRERRSIHRIAEAVGFYDPSVFSRAFRRRFGESPRALREAALAGRPVPAAAAPAAPRGFLDLVARMGA